MTNEQIIAQYCEENGITEQIHTYNRWKQLGFQVQKGSKAVAKITIWKASRKKSDEDDEDEPRMFMKTASFFAASQVEPVKA